MHLILLVLHFKQATEDLIRFSGRRLPAGRLRPSARITGLWDGSGELWVVAGEAYVVTGEGCSDAGVAASEPGAADASTRGGGSAIGAPGE
jgi:hypothetical protein